MPEQFVVKKYSMTQLKDIYQEDPYLAVSLADEDQIEKLIKLGIFSEEIVKDLSESFDIIHDKMENFW